MKLHLTPAVALCVFLSACATQPPATGPAAATAAKVPAADAGPALHGMFERYFEDVLRLNPLLLLSPSDRSLFVLGATGVIPIDSYQRWWTLVSAGYLHGGLLHIFFNMAAFRQLSAVVVREFGIRRMFAIYALGSVAGFGASYLAGISLTIGASAGVCGLVGAIMYFGKSRGGAYGTALYKQVGMWVVIMFVFGFAVPGINNWGHAGGIGAGALLGYLLGYTERKRETAVHQKLAILCLAGTAGILAWAIITSLYYRLL